MPTRVKGLRLTDREIRRAQRLQRFYPESNDITESQWLIAIWRRGLVLLEAEVAAAGGGPPPGMTEDEIATIATQRLSATVQWLARTGRIPLIEPAAHMALPTVPPALAADEVVIDAASADDMADLGADFL